KLENNLEITNEDLKGADTITRKVDELSHILEQIESLDFDTVKIEDIEKIIEISNPIYEEINV
ncbi:MAG: hypothetical protein U9N59_09900, partial [Campylobacterota bacterium]|nr:hypothetical protein [Campylobacterota bacterium]